MKRDTKTKRNTRMDLLSKSLVRAVKNDSVFGEIMLGKIYFSNIGSKKVRKDKVYQASADRLVKVCPACKLAWEGIKLSSTQTSKNTKYYKNFPKYGKKVELCDNCKGENNE